MAKSVFNISHVVSIDDWLSILKWIHPYDAFRIAHVSKSFHRMIYSAGYASATLEIHTYEPESDEAKGLHSVFIRVPSNHFQKVYANKVLKGLSEFNINDFIDIDEDSPPKELRGYPMFAALCSLTKLTEVSVKQSNLVGCIPRELQVLTSLKTLILPGNDIQGCIPSELGLLSNLEYLNLCKNRNLSGPFPPELGALKKLLSMDLSFTSLTGPIPSTWGQLENLQRLQLQGNKGLCGAIPSELGNMNSLMLFNASQCGLEGAIPWELSKLVNLQVLLLSQNRLSGKVPNELTNIPNIFCIELFGNEDLDCWYVL